MGRRAATQEPSGGHRGWHGKKGEGVGRGRPCGACGPSEESGLGALRSVFQQGNNAIFFIENIPFPSNWDHQRLPPPRSSSV